MPMRAADSRIHYQPPPARQLLTIGELERLYGRDATVEVDAASPPAFPPAPEQPVIERPFAEPSPMRTEPPPTPRFYQQDAPRFYRQDLEELDEIEDVVPRPRSPFLPLTVAIVAGAAGLLGYGLFLRGYLDLPTLVSRAELTPTVELPIERSFEAPSFPVLVDDGFRTTARSEQGSQAGSAPAPDLASVLSEQVTEQAAPPSTEQTAPPSAKQAAPPSAKQAVRPRTAKTAATPPPSKPSSRARAASRTPPAARVGRSRNVSVDDAATMELIRRESVRAEQDRAARERRIEQSITGKPSNDADPPGYIEADEPAD